MKVVHILFLITLFPGCHSQMKTPVDNITPGPLSIVIHGGAGTILRENMTPEKEKAYQDKLSEALDSGYAILERGGKSIDAVIAAVKVMENSPLFNAGRGAVFTNDGRNEMDASVMEGSNLMAGAVAGVTIIKNPITAAHVVMTKSPHVMMAGEGAEKFAIEQGLEIVEPAYFFDSARYQQLIRIREKSTSSLQESLAFKDEKFGTVGAVALDQYGNLAAGTSTGGMSNKRYGRIGDTPIIGAGTYADNNTCGVSATGHGEFFMRSVAAYDIAAMMQYGNLTLMEAADSLIMKKLPRIGGEGGIIGLDRQGNIVMTFNSRGMYRGFIRRGEKQILIYED